MKKLYRIFLQLFTYPSRPDEIQTEAKNFFDYSSGEKIKILRAAGKEAQREQQKLLEAYDARFGRMA